MTELSQRTMTAFEISGGEVVEHHGAVLQFTFGQFTLDTRLARQQPVHGGVEFGFVGGIEGKQFAETAVESVGMQAAGGGEFGGRTENAGGNHGDDEIALPAGFGIDNRRELKFAQRAEYGGNVTVRPGSVDTECFGQGQTGD
jgi:hypothetical protein